MIIFVRNAFQHLPNSAVWTARKLVSASLIIHSAFVGKIQVCCCFVAYFLLHSRESYIARPLIHDGWTTKLCVPFKRSLFQWLSRWWFQIFSIFTPTWGDDPIRLIFFKWVETTNYSYMFIFWGPCFSDDSSGYNKTKINWPQNWLAQMDGVTFQFTGWPFQSFSHHLSVLKTHWNMSPSWYLEPVDVSSVIFVCLRFDWFCHSKSKLLCDSIRDLLIPYLEVT